MVVHENLKNALFDIIRATISDYESGGSKFPPSDPFGKILSGVQRTKLRVLIMNRSYFYLSVFFLAVISSLSGWIQDLQYRMIVSSIAA